MAKRRNPKKRTKKPRLAAATKMIENNLNGTIATFNLDSFDHEDEVFYSLDEIIKDMKKRIEYGVEWSTKYVYEALGVAAENWYNDYEPKKYTRTETLYNTPDYYASGYGGHVYLDIPVGLYTTIIENAEEGIHGHVEMQGDYVRDWRVGGDTGIGIWRELIYFLDNGEWNTENSETYASMKEIENSQMINFAFHAGVFAKGKAPFGKK